MSRAGRQFHLGNEHKPRTAFSALSLEDYSATGQWLCSNAIWVLPMEVGSRKEVTIVSFQISEFKRSWVRS